MRREATEWEHEGEFRRAKEVAARLAAERKAAETAKRLASAERIAERAKQRREAHADPITPTVGPHEFKRRGETLAPINTKLKRAEKIERNKARKVKRSGSALDAAREYVYAKYGSLHMTDLSDLTPRQLAIASLVAQGKSVKQIAAELSIGERRVRVLITSVAYRIGADASLDERVQVALWWQVQTALRDAA